MKENCGIDLTDSLAMTPAASVSGLYFAHPKSEYFSVGKLCPDQIVDYASRKGVNQAEVETLLASYLSY